MLRNGNKYLLMLVSIIMLTACISQSKTSFIPPQDRESLLAEQPWPHNGFVAISWHNVEDEAADQRFMSVRTSALREQFAGCARTVINRSVLLKFVKHIEEENRYRKKQ